MHDNGNNLAGLLPVESMPQIAGLAVPETFYLVIHEPAPLAGMIRPNDRTPWDEVFSLGIRQVVCLTEGRPNYRPQPLHIAGHFPLQDLYGGITPSNPESEQNLIYAASQMVLSLIKRGVGVAVHCAGGTGRTGTIIGCTLKGLGYNSEQIISYLDQLTHRRIKGCGWPESKWQAEMVLKFGNPLIRTSGNNR